MIGLAGLVRGFADQLRPSEGNADRLDAWIATARAADLPHLHALNGSDVHVSFRDLRTNVRSRAHVARLITDRPLI
ncbi:hypothetical protein GCM10010412_088430 [Nonomuraea recticatena]|uniref:Uncharacterized protein n=1 Tax=Nonomuraea recticatena TaxID=46178 RepID=A0ABP6FN69_9ACTN